MTMNVQVKWQGAPGMAFVATTASGHMVCMDGAVEGGGNNLAPRPMELILSGTGACTAYDVVLILRNSGQDVAGCDVALSATRAEKEPKVFTQIDFHFVLQGRQLKTNLVEHAIKRSFEKYCSATAMLNKTAEIRYTFEVQEPS